MATKVDRSVVNENLREFDRLYRESANAYILTCRTHFFQDRAADEFLLGYQTLYLVEWTIRDLESYLTKRFPGAAQKYLDMVRRSKRLKDIARTPQFVEMLFELSDDSISADKDIGSHALYTSYVRRWIEKESTRRGAVMSSSQRQRFAELIAVKLFAADKNRVHYGELYSIAREFSGYGDPTHLDYFDTDARTCTFITRDSDGYYGFRHRSFMEYFCAQIVVKEATEGAPSVLSSRELSPEILTFIAEVPLEREAQRHLEEWVQAEQAGDSQRILLARNSATILAIHGRSASSLPASQPGMTSDWSRLREAVGSKDSQLFGELVERLYPELRILAANLAPNDEDVLQDALVRIWSAMDSGKLHVLSDHDFKRYFAVLLRNTSIDRMRMRSRRLEVPIEAVDAMSIQSLRTEMSDAVLGENWIMERARSVLNEHEYRVLEYKVSGHSYEEIARELNMNTVSIKSVYYRIIQKLRRAFREEQGEL
jgi:RNA polymerase sigma factor (sigma-70 family)